MKNVLLAIVFGSFIYFNPVQSKSLKSKHGNSIDEFKGERKSLAGPWGNVIHGNYKRAKRQLPVVRDKFQETVTKAKYDCVSEMKMDTSVLEKSIMYKEDATEEEKCLLMCMLKKTKLMEDSNKVSAKTVARIAGDLSEENPLVVSIAVATANNCNKLISTTKPCEAAFQINRCVVNALRGHKLNISY